jgi:hypothetical protein
MLALFLASPICLGEDAATADVDRLREENKELAERLRQLEQTSLEASVDEYLAQTSTPPTAQGKARERRDAAAGIDDVFPGGEKFRVSGQVRYRFEYRKDNYAPKGTPGTPAYDGGVTGDLHFFRVRVRFDYEIQKDIVATVELQDVRTFGQAQSTTGYLGNVDLRRGLVEFRNISDTGISVELGRYVMFYGDQRLIGHLEWANSARTYDGFRAKWKKDKAWVDFFYAKPRETLNPVTGTPTYGTADDDQDFAGVYGGWSIVEGYLLYLSDRLASTGEVGAQTANIGFMTIGARVHGDVKGFDYTGEFTYQTGDYYTDDLNAFGAVIDLGYTFGGKTKPRVGLVFAYATGDKDPTDGKNEKLQTLFPTNHLHYGYIDFVGWSNIINLEINFRIEPTKNIFVEVAYHHFSRPEEQGAWVNAGGGTIRPGQAGAGSSLGDEIDLIVTWKATKAVLLEAGYAIFLPGNFIDDTNPAGVSSDTSHWFYFMVLVRF